MRAPTSIAPTACPFGMAGAWICSILPTFLCLVATVLLIWPGFGVNWFGAGGNPNASLAFLSFSHQRLQYELSQIVPLALIVVIGLAFYFLGGKTRREPAARAGRRGGHPGRPHAVSTMTRAAPFGFINVVSLSHMLRSDGFRR